jgi:hypothetical protein
LLKIENGGIGNNVEQRVILAYFTDAYGNPYPLEWVETLLNRIKRT